MVSVKFAPKDTPDIGQGHWTWPIQSLKDATLIEKVVQCGIAIQESLDKLDHQETPRDITNLQRLWEKFKTDIQKIAKGHTKKT